MVFLFEYVGKDPADTTNYIVIETIKNGITGQTTKP